MRLGNGRCLSLTPLLLLLLLLLLVDPGESCGPGRRRRPRRLTPLVFKQHVPNVSENTLGASGLEDGRIRRGDAKFKDLTKNTNTDILFKDEEGTGADRLMSKRCNQKLNDLAILVVNQWKGVKLRVTEAWDEDNFHAHNSLHYEGRAVDITTSDRDRVKYGMLARLAVEAGFDWVYYESRGHIHCSVKSDSSVAIKIGGCFSSESRVVLSSGQTMPITDLQVGHSVLAMNSQGQLVYSDVIGFLDRSSDKLALFYTVTTDTGKSITLTAKHLIYTHEASAIFSSSSSPSSTESPSLSQSPTSSYPTLKFAEEVKVGDYIVVASAQRQTDGDDVTSDSDDVTTSTTLHRVASVHKNTKEGYFAPLTTEGTIVVDGVVASCYAFLNRETFVHSLFAPMRAFYAFKTFMSDVWQSAVTKYSWLEPMLESLMSLFLDSKEESSRDIYSNRNNNVTSGVSHHQHRDVHQEGAHWYARLLYSVAVNVIGMDIFISM